MNLTVAQPCSHISNDLEFKVAAVVKIRSSQSMKWNGNCFVESVLPFYSLIHPFSSIANAYIWTYRNETPRVCTRTFFKAKKKRRLICMLFLLSHENEWKQFSIFSWLEPVLIDIKIKRWNVKERVACGSTDIFVEACRAACLIQHKSISILLSFVISKGEVFIGTSK